MANIVVDNIRNDVTISQGLVALRLDNKNITFNDALELHKWLNRNFKGLSEIAEYKPAKREDDELITPVEAGKYYLG